MSATKNLRVTIETAPHPNSDTRSRASASGAGSSPILVEHPDQLKTLPNRQRRRPSETDADWEDFDSELHPSDSVSYTRVSSSRQERPHRKHSTRSRSKHHYREELPPLAPEPTPATHDRRRRREEPADYRDYDRAYNPRRNSSRASDRLIHSEVDYYHDYNEHYMYDRRDSRRRKSGDRYAYDSRRYDYSPPNSHVTAYSGYAPSNHIVHYQPQYPSYQYSPYTHPGYPVSPPSSSAGGYFPHLVHHYPPSQASTSARTDDTTASIKQLKDAMEKKQDEALRKQEEHFARMQAKLDAETATRLAHDKAREDDLKRQKEELRRAAELAAAAEAAKLQAEAAAAKREKEAEDKALKEKAQYEIDLLTLQKQKDDARKAEEALKSERDALLPPADDTLAAVKFKDAGGRTWTFPWKFCKQWKTMQILITKCCADHPAVFAQVEAGRYWLFGPDEVVIMPELWEHTVQPGWEIAMQLWPLPPPRKEESRRRREEAVEDGPPAPPPPMQKKEKEKEKKKTSSSSARPKSIQHTVVELPDRSKKTASSRRLRRAADEAVSVPPSPPVPSLPRAGSAGSEFKAAGHDDDDAVVEVVTARVEPAADRRKRRISPRPDSLPLMARWMIGALPPRESRRR